VKRACGCRCIDHASILCRFDVFLCTQGLQQCELPKSLSWQWLAKQPYESAKTQLSRISVVRQFAMYMSRMGHPADVPDRGMGAKWGTNFSAHVFTHDEVHRLIDSVDRLAPDARAPMRHVVMPEVFRLLYGCGLRLNEALKLRMDDVDLVQGVLRINGAKFGKDRLVPPALPLVQRLQKYADEIVRQPAGAYFFPSPCGERWGMHLLQSGVSLEIIRDFLGHVDVKTTQIYARANLEMKRRALEKVADDTLLPSLPSWQQNKTLLDWVHSL
jgi:site-specific recombinase XerD